MLSNQQTPQPSRDFDGKYLVNSIFYTIQGEGPFSGRAAIFVRLAGCNLQCPLCDTEYTNFESMKTAELGYAARDAKGSLGTNPIIVITGGEPFRQDLAPFVEEMLEWGYSIQVETNGTMAPSDRFKHLHATWSVGKITVVCSPKAHFLDPWIFDNADAFKYVLSAGDEHPDDGLPQIALGRGRKVIARPRVGAPVYVQPTDVQDEQVNALNRKAVAETCMRHGYIAQLQSHKYFGVE